MPKPTLLVVIDDMEPRHRFAQALRWRFGADFDVIAEADPVTALRRLEDLRREQIAVPIVIADLRLPVPGMIGTEFLTQARHLMPASKRILLIDYSDPPGSNLAVFEGMAFGLVDRVLTKQGYPAEEWLYPTISEFLADWSRSTPRPRFEALRVIGEQWDARSHELRDLLSRNGVPFGFYDVRSEEGQRLLARYGAEDAPLPVVAAYTGQVLIAPSNEDVASTMGVRLIPEPGIYDVVMIGGGPAGLSASVYGASEGLRTLMLEPEAAGGQASASAMIRNYLGFPEGISGMRLGQNALQQAHYLGATTIFDRAVALRTEGPLHVVSLAEGPEIPCRTVVLATGVTYRRLNIPALEDLAGAGVFYGAATTEARALSGQPVFIVGAGNSAGQAALYLARYAQQVTILCRGASLSESMSAYLIRRIEATENVTVLLQTRIVDGGGRGRLEWLALETNGAGGQVRVAAAAVFVLIGGEPRTEWLAGVVARDERGYLLTGRAVRQEAALTASWPLERPPGLLETSLPGVFAAGDVRFGATKRVATAVGDGALVIRLVHEFLADEETTS